MALRFELLALGSALIIQLFYSQLYETFFQQSAAEPGTTAPSASPSTPKVDDVPNLEVIEVREYLSSECDGPPARVWEIRVEVESTPDHPGVLPCIKIRPQMKVPGEMTSRALAENLYGRVSCETLRHEEGGFLDLCSDETCSEAGCQRISIVPEGECGLSFTGFSAVPGARRVPFRRRLQSVGRGMRRSLAGLAGVAGPIWSCWLFAPCRHFSPAGRCGHIHLRAEKIIDLSSLDLSVNDTDEADDWEAMIDRMDFQGGLPTASDFRAPEQSSAYDEEAFLEIEATELKRALQNGYAIWDVREPDEYRLGHLPQSKNVPLSDLEAALEPFPERGLLLICATGSRSSQAQVRLSRVYGISNVFSVRGGLAAWEAAGGQVSLNYSGDDL